MVRCLVRAPGRAENLQRSGGEIRRGDVTDPPSLTGLGEGIDVAYFLVHAMAGGAGYSEREQSGARNFARMAKQDGIGRIVYLGGLGDETVSKHLSSRHDT